MTALIIEFLLGPFGKAILVASLTALAWFHGNRSGHSDERAKIDHEIVLSTKKVISKYESDVLLLKKQIEEDIARDQKYKKEIDDRKKTEKELSDKLKKAMENKEVYIKCVADDQVLDVLNESLGKLK